MQQYSVYKCLCFRAWTHAADKAVCLLADQKPQQKTSFVYVIGQWRRAFEEEASPIKVRLVCVIFVYYLETIKRPNSLLQMAGTGGKLQNAPDADDLPQLPWNSTRLICRFFLSNTSFAYFQVIIIQLNVSFILRFYRTDGALQNAKLLSLLINCDRFTCRQLCGLLLGKNRYVCKFWSSQKNESRKQADSS